MLGLQVVNVQLNYSCWRSSFVQIDVLFPSWPTGRLRSLNTNQQAGHELVFITLSPLYDSQPWLRDQLPDFSFCCTATDSERLWLRGSIRDQPEESLFDGWDQQSPSELANNTCIPSVSLSHTQTYTLLLTYNNSHILYCVQCEREILKDENLWCLISANCSVQTVATGEDGPEKQRSKTLQSKLDFHF